MILNRWFQLGVAIAITAVAFTAIGVLIAESETVSSVKEVAGTVATGEFPERTASVGRVVLTTGASIPYIVAVKGEAGRPARDATDIALPLTAAEAVAAGWTDPILCSVGRGRYFQKGTVGEGDPAYYVLAHLRYTFNVFTCPYCQQAYTNVHYPPRARARLTSSGLVPVSLHPGLRRCFQHYH